MMLFLQGRGCGGMGHKALVLVMMKHVTCVTRDTKAACAQGEREEKGI